MDKSFYDDHRGSRCPDRLFSKDVRKIKQSIDAAMDKYARTVTPDEIEAIFMSENTTLTTAQKTAYSDLFLKIKRSSHLVKMLQQMFCLSYFSRLLGKTLLILVLTMLTVLFPLYNPSETFLIIILMILSQILMSIGMIFL